MENTILTNTKKIKLFTSISGSIDEHKVNPHIYNAQILYLEPMLGSSLYEKIINLVETDMITGTTYQVLLDDYITPSLIFHAMEMFVVFNSFITANGGTFQFQPSNANPSGVNEIDKMGSKYKVIASKYDDKLNKYLCANSNLFPEYINNTGIVSKTQNTNQGGFYLGYPNRKFN